MEALSINRHGAGKFESPYLIKQLGYGGSEAGFVEVLMIENPPPGLSGFVIHEHCRDGNGALFRFSEWNSLENALAAHRGAIRFDESHLKHFPGFIRMVPCYRELPCFYKQAENSISPCITESTCY